jgi:hypothetical protein
MEPVPKELTKKLHRIAAAAFTHSGSRLWGSLMPVHDLSRRFRSQKFRRWMGPPAYVGMTVAVLFPLWESLWLLSAHTAQGQRNSLPAASDSYWFVWHPGESAPQRGRILQLEGGEVRILTPEGLERVLRGAYHWQREQFPLPPFPTGPQIITTAGDRLAGSVEGLETGRLLFQPSALGKQPPLWKLPFSALQAAWWTDLPADTPIDPAIYSWSENHKNRDTLRLRNGDVLAGVLLEETDALEDHAWQLQTSSGQVQRLTPAQIAAIRFNPALARRRLPKEPVLLVVLHDGSRLHLTRFRLAHDQLHGVTLWGEAVMIPWSKVVLGSITSPAAPRLTDLTPAKIEHQPYLDGSPPPSFQRRHNGLELQLIGRAAPITADWGFALPPQTALHYELKQPYRRLESWVSLAPEAAPTSRVRLRILRDDKAVTLPQDGLLTYGPAQLLQVPLDNVRRLTLIVDFPSRGEPGAITVWGWPRLVP